MFSNMTRCGGTMDQHTWIVNAMVDLAAYAERHDLKRLNDELCHVLANALLGELAGCASEPIEECLPVPANVVRIGGNRPQSS